MKTYKLTLAFDDLNHAVDFLKIGLNKPILKATETLTSMGLKGQVGLNPDKSVSVTWFFRTKPKYDKVIDAYIKCRIAPSQYISPPVKTEYSISQ
jgi:hypothetical protein